MTDKDIIKALKCCCNTDCENCDLFDVQYCDNYLHQQCIDLINRQQAEIERLKIVNRVYEDIGKSIQMEAIKEFAETLKFMAKKNGAYDYVSWHQIDSVEKELTGNGVEIDV